MTESINRQTLNQETRGLGTNKSNANGGERAPGSKPASPQSGTGVTGDHVSLSASGVQLGTAVGGKAIVSAESALALAGYVRTQIQSNGAGALSAQGAGANGVVRRLLGDG